MPSIHSQGPIFNSGLFKRSKDSQIYAHLSELMAFLHYFEKKILLLFFFPMSFESVMDREYDNIKYKQWVSTDRCNLVEKVELFDQFIDSLCKNAVKLTRHHYIAKKQNEFLKDLKKTMSYDTIIIVGDFSENYAYVVQDAAQEFHWENSQCTVHPFVVYFKDIETNECKHASYCFLSPNTNHNATIVYTFF